jgi:hypothetical protein
MLGASLPENRNGAGHVSLKNKMMDKVPKNEIVSVNPLKTKRICFI